MAVTYTIYFYGGKFSGPEMTKFRCPECSRIMFKHNSKHILISNAYGAGVTDIVAGQRDDEGRPIFIDVRCHGCKSLYKISFT